MNTTTLTKPKSLTQQLENEKSKYGQAFEEDKPFAFIKMIQIRIKQLEQQAKSAFNS